MCWRNLWSLTNDFEHRSHWYNRLLSCFIIWSIKSSPYPNFLPQCLEKKRLILNEGLSGELGAYMHWWVAFSSWDLECRMMFLMLKNVFRHSWQVIPWCWFSSASLWFFMWLYKTSWSGKVEEQMTQIKSCEESLTILDFSKTSLWVNMWRSKAVRELNFLAHWSQWILPVLYLRGACLRLLSSDSGDISDFVWVSACLEVNEFQFYS